jgi:hypothetical protein
MAAPVSFRMRHAVAERAAYRCEYCGLPERFALHAHEPDHIVPRQHAGESRPQNLAWACLRCNRYKGPNVGSFDPVTGQLVPFFNPRTQEWTTHFAWEGATIQPLTPEGRVTVTILRRNDADRVAERQRLMAMGLYG